MKNKKQSIFIKFSTRFSSTYINITTMGVSLSRFDERMAGINEAERLLVDNPKLSGKLNFRQLVLLRHALKHPCFSYVVWEHQRSHGISYGIARKGLSDMLDKLKLLIKTRQGRRYYFVVPGDLEQRVVARQINTLVC
ncbi:hypothetical protein MNBD_GAMMA11-3194 [hydrothermal vent metagenome]|uniref:Uncharacterized protein n=1 Tax=hydrothermal vent metagenome TaxID=652676 RepID=A0A3B0Y3A8_9ZZZZ